MALPSISEIRIKPYPKDHVFNCDAWDGKNPVGTLRAVWDQSEPENSHIILFDRILTEFDYRGMGIGRSMLDHFLAWCKEREGATIIKGFIDENMLENDTPEHVAAYLIEQGFTVEGCDFHMNIAR